jgi:hypothetical protein
MVPALVQLPGIADGVLPVGLHFASLAEVRDLFVYNQHRGWLFEGLVFACLELRKFGCARVYLGGSFVTSIEYPGDYDACWDPAGVSADVDPLLWDDMQRIEQNRKYRGDLLVSAAGDGPEHQHFKFLCKDKLTGAAKGIVGIKLKMVELLNLSMS